MKEDTVNDAVTEVEGTVEPEPGPATVGWHIHRWTKWSDPFRISAGGLTAAISGDKTARWYQDRTCVRCNLVERVPLANGSVVHL